MRLVVDRVEGAVAVCETDEGSFVEIGVDDLPQGAKEGSVLKGELGSLELDDEERMARERKVASLMDSLFVD